ncbi:hypothetical protein H4R20_007331 [Coemansia guatemalensis]|uniref:Uncharacterized protein n=1 Tax=Coemansia guatemalensis TaxID=2761395 RepID=A0A9W8HP26_9FUNG|nr:hypothetical protein H4R20_007331 [Coemansia guatemalensis]
MFTFSSTLARAFQLAGTRFTSSHSQTSDAPSTTQTVTSVATPSAFHNSFNCCADFKASLGHQQQVQREEALPIDWLLGRFRYYHNVQLERENMYLNAAMAEETQQCEALERDIKKMHVNTDGFVELVIAEWGSDRETVRQKREEAESKLAVARYVMHEHQQIREELVANLAATRKAIAEQIRQQVVLKYELSEAIKTGDARKEQNEALKLKVEEEESKDKRFPDAIEREFEAMREDINQEWTDHVEQMSYKYLNEMDRITSFSTRPRTPGGSYF